MKNDKYADILNYKEVKPIQSSLQDLLGPNSTHISFEKKILSGFFNHNEKINWGKFELQAQLDNIFEYTATLTNSSVLQFIIENKKSLAEYYGYAEDEIQILNAIPKITKSTLLPDKISFTNLLSPNCKMVIGHIGLYQIENLNFNKLERVWGKISIRDIKNIHFEKLKYIMSEMKILRCEDIFFNQLKIIPNNCEIFLSHNIQFGNLEYIGNDMIYGMGNYNLCFSKLEEIGGNLYIGTFCGIDDLVISIQELKKMSYLYKETDGFPSLKTVKEDVKIRNAVCNVSNLEKVYKKLYIDTSGWNYLNLPPTYKLNFSSLLYVGSSFTYSGNGYNIIGFPKLRSVFGTLKLSSGKNIELSKLTLVKGKITIDSNACELQNLQDYYGNKRRYTITNGKISLDKIN